ncbi:MAG: hemolysin III family protein, partial [Rikenellaceae bacterium]|nr:hemolysin III family protein [Rikenellaceae bacterium]
MKTQNGYSLSEEIVNSSTHAVGLVMGVVVCLFFLVKGAVAESWVVTASFVLYLFGVVSSYATSTIYHATPARKVEAKALARKFDHAAIYWHIAGSYSPVTLVAMLGGGERVWGLVIFAFVWLCAI